MNFLKEILDHTRKDVRRRKNDFPVERLRRRPLYGRKSLSLEAALRAGVPSVIAEIKKASPSRGVICRDFDPARTAVQYEQGGAAAISVLTEEKYFLGSLDDMEKARASTSLPILRKDFIVDSYQVHEAKAYGADAVLLIASALVPGDIASLRDEAASLGMEALVEIHSESELAALGGMEIHLIGINNRNLSTFETDIALCETLAPLLPSGALGIGESGIHTGADILRLRRAGIGSFLVGEQFMRADDPGSALRELLGSGG